MFLCALGIGGALDLEQCIDLTCDLDHKRRKLLPFPRPGVMQPGPPPARHPEWSTAQSACLRERCMRPRFLGCCWSISCVVVQLVHLPQMTRMARWRLTNLLQLLPANSLAPCRLRSSDGSVNPRSQSRLTVRALALLALRSQFVSRRLQPGTELGT